MRISYIMILVLLVCGLVNIREDISKSSPGRVVTLLL